MAKEEEKHDSEDIFDIEYMKEKGGELLLCKKTGIKTERAPKTVTWKVGRSVDGMVVSVSGRGVRVLITSDRAPISLRPVGYGSLATDGMYLPAETVMGLVPLLDVAARVSMWLQKHSE